jgi:hypothetical protein
MSAGLGFWSLDVTNGVLTCDPVAASILNIPGSSICELAQVLLRIHSADRPRLLRSGLKSMRHGTTFDVVAHMWVSSDATRALRFIGGLGYQLGQRDPEIHGVVEQLIVE